MADAAQASAGTGEEVGTPVSDRSSSRRLLIRTLLPGLYAWVSTVAYPTTYRSAPTTTRILAFGALLALVVGPLLVTTGRVRLGRALGLFGFLGLSVVTWLLLGDLISVSRVEPVRASLGALGWALFALGWGQVREVGQVPEEDPRVIHGAPLEPRGQLSPGAQVALALGLVGAAIPLFLAWRVTRPAAALLAHSAAVAAALGMLLVSGRVALDQARYRPRTASARLSAAAPALGVLLIVLVFGLATIVLW